jgi:F0F1-type ATP synthase assembly protein I
MRQDNKYKIITKGVTHLSLGISIVVAIIIGILIGILLEYIFNVKWVFFIGVFWGISASILNVYKAYKSQQKEYEQYKKEDEHLQEVLKNMDKE